MIDSILDARDSRVSAVVYTATRHITATTLQLMLLLPLRLASCTKISVLGTSEHRRAEAPGIAVGAACSLSRCTVVPGETGANRYNARVVF